MKITRLHTAELRVNDTTFAADYTETIRAKLKWRKVSVSIKEKDKVILDLPGLEVPEHWSQAAADILAHKYLRKVGIPLNAQPAAEEKVPSWLQRTMPPKVNGTAPETTSEKSAHQVFRRIAGHWTYSGWKHGYFDTEADAAAYYDEMYAMLYYQIAAPNSPQWFNTGLWWAYGIAGRPNGSYIAQSPEEREENDDEVVSATPNSYQYPQTSACFILGLKDSLLEEGGIADTLKEEARIFKFGSGSGINYSTLRAQGTPLYNGGVSSGLMSFLNTFDANAGSIKSGGTTRRAARMVVVDCDHPEAETFVEWKAKEEIKVAAMAAARTAVKATDTFAANVLSSLGAEYEGEAYRTVGGQNANNSLRVTDEFMHWIDSDTASSKSPAPGKSFTLTTAIETQLRAQRLWSKTIDAAWRCGDPGVQFHNTCNAWHTIPKVAPQRATNPCSEYSFIDDSACNLASLNLVTFLDGGRIDAAAFEHAVRLWTITLDITVSMSSYPNARIAENAAAWRTLGLGYANLGGLLMLLGLPYDSDDGRRVAATITSAMQAVAWSTSAEMAADPELGPFLDYRHHADDVLRVLDKHRDAWAQVAVGARMESDSVFHLHELATAEWETLGRERPPIRNAQLTLLAPTGTISFVLDAATTGIEPDFSLVKYKKLAGGGSMTIVNGLVEKALSSLGYSQSEVTEITDYVKSQGRVDKVTPHIRTEHIRIFDCANDIEWTGHVRMMIAVQPFLSGAISKTINMPNSATREDVGSAYLMAWKGGLKALAVYRDGCKLSQPLTAVVASPVAATAGQDVSPLASTAEPSQPPARRGDVRSRGRYKLPSRRRGFTQKVSVGGHKLYVRTGEYADGALGEVFLTISKEGSTLKHLVDAVAMSVSIGLQYGVPLGEYTDAFVGSKSDPCGLVQGSDNVKMCSSLMDYVFKELDAEYGDRQYVPGSYDKEAPIAATAPVTAEITSETVPAEQVAEVAALLEQHSVAVPQRERERVTLAPELTVVEGGKVDEVATPAPTSTDDAHVDEAEPQDDEPLPRILRSAAPSEKTVFRTLAAPRYLGDACSCCGEFTLRHSGACKVCDSCGQTTGCS